MRQLLTIEDEKHLTIRSLSIDYSSGYTEASHAHGWPQLLYAETGSIIAKVADVIWIIPPRRALWIPAGSRHSLTMMGAVKLRTLYCRTDFFPDTNTGYVFQVSGLLHEVILRVCALQYLDGRSQAEQRLANIIGDEVNHADPSMLQLPLPQDKRARRLANLFIEGASGELANLYTKTGMSRRTAERVFQKETGLSPARWRRLILLSRAFQALAQGESIENAADKAGYQTRSAFSDTFRKTFGFPPSALQ